MEFEVLPVTPYKMNCSIVWCDKTMRAAVIDPGGDLDAILDYLELLELTPEVALITHGHFDHCGAAARFAAATGARIEGPHRADAATIGRIPTFSAQHGAVGEGFLPDRWLEHGDVVTFGEERLEVLHCPGHSPGHVAYFSAAGRRAFVGDILFKGTIGAWDHPEGDLPTLLSSIRERLFPLGEDVAFVPGHGGGSTFGRERRDNAFVSDAADGRRRASIQTASSE